MSAPREEEVRLVKSGGPVTPEGKARSARNAVKHGLRASAVVIPGESAEEWNEHRDGVLATLAPTNALEESLVERIAEITWRMRRVASTEADGITKHAQLFGSDDGVAPIPRDSLQRYETHLSRQLALAIATLERVRMLAV